MALTDALLNEQLLAPLGRSNKKRLCRRDGKGTAYGK